MDKYKLTIGDLLNNASANYPDNDALVYLDPVLRYSYRDFSNICNRAAKGFMGLGVNKGDHMAVWANNVPEWVVVQFAAAKIGAILVTVNTNYQGFELEYLLKQSDTKHLVLIGGIKGDEYLDIIYGLCPELENSKPGALRLDRFPLLKNIIYLGEEYKNGMFNWENVLSLADNFSDSELKTREDSTLPDDVINMQYTSGTTGFPKGVMLTHSNIVGNAFSVADCMNFTENDRLCIPVPFFHCFGCVLSNLVCVVSGATMIPIVYYSPERVLVTVEKERCTALHGVPTMFISELEQMTLGDYDTSTLRTGIMAGAPCPIEVMKSVCNTMGIREICITYGLTEASPAVTMTRTDDPIELRVNSVGKPIPDVGVKIINLQTGEMCLSGEYGELCTKGYHVMKGYYNFPHESETVVDSEGWLHTGDLGTVDEDGYYRITGRIKDMIVRGGENIYPREVEEFLHRYPKIKNVHVVGVPSKKYGEEIAAFIQLKDGETCLPDEIREFCVGSISKHKIPVIICFVDDYPITASGKVKKYQLREIAINNLKVNDLDDSLETV